VEVSLFDSLAEWMSFPAYHTAYTGQELRRSGPNHISIAPYGPFRTADGPVYLSIQNAREWDRFCADVLKRPELRDDERYRSGERRSRYRDDLRADIEAVFSSLPREEVIARLERSQIAYARMNTVGEFLQHPQLLERGRWMTVGSEVGDLRMLRPPVDLEGVDPVMEDVPALGAHSTAILRELGFDSEQVARWQKEKVI
jgi:itaconate CoA-transferase